RQFGYRADGALVIDRVRVEARTNQSDAEAALALLPVAGEYAGDDAAADAAAVPTPIATVACHHAGQQNATPLFDRAHMVPGMAVDGPALIIDPLATTSVEPGWSAHIGGDGTLRLCRATPPAAEQTHPTQSMPATPADPVRLEIFNGLFMAIAQEMGGALQRSALSVNIRERLDFSCAIFDAAGALVANAPHMPVHLGSMGESVRTILHRRAGDGRGLCRGDVYALNAPYDGGTHLPDLTVIMPVFIRDGAQTPDAFVAARGHHADIGGISPGSMPPNSTTMDEEGILFDNHLIVDRGQFLERDIARHLGAGPWPSRNIALNIADMRAQIAACARGAAELQRMAGQYSVDVVRAYMRHGQDQAEQAVRRLIGTLRDGHFDYAMDNGARVVVRVAVDHAARDITIDFTGTSAVLPNNFNAPLPVVRAAILYVLRTMIDDAIPMNDGCMAPVRLIVPDGCMLRPRAPAAVVAGNVEPSQVVPDALFGAFGAMAAAQGTMNNLTFGNDAHQYYETIAGGAGAGPGFDGASAVQTHMTNSRLTDPEILETRFPVMVEQFAIRAGSGGAGQWRGGDGVIRQLRFLERMDAGILSNRRIVPPFGLHGGQAGACGANHVLRADGTCQPLPATASIAMNAGDQIIIETPGGGGYGAPAGGDAVNTGG
ncbi:MAG: hydantoinase B/oxoprolinase family protein, partial [Sphingopyxis sp.]